MKYFKDKNGEVFAYEDDGSKDYLIGDKVKMTEEEVELHINPPKTEEQIVAEKVAEAKAYLASTDFKVLPDYEPKSDEVITLRATAREFIRVNDVSNP